MIRFLAILAITLLAGCGNPTAPVPGEAPDPFYRMRTKYDCGPAALAFAAQIPYSTVCAAWGWRNFGDDRDNLLDTPVSHFAAMKKLGIRYRQVTADDIVAGKAQPLRTVVLVHGKDFPLWEQHWTALGGVTSDSVFLFFGDSESARVIAHDKFLERFWDSVPNVAYEVLQ